MMRVRRPIELVAPKSAAIREIRLLPRVNLTAPILTVLEGDASDLPGIFSGGIEEFGVVADPLASRAVLHDGEIPRESHGNQFIFTGSEREAHSDGGGQFLAAAGNLGIEIRKAAIGRERLPNLCSRSDRTECGCIGYVDTRAGKSGDCKLAVPSLGDRAISNAIEDDALHVAAGKFFGMKTVGVQII